MGLSFLTEDMQNALLKLNYNLLSEIRLRYGQPIIVEYTGKYFYLASYGITQNSRDALTCGNIDGMLLKAMGGCIYNYTEQIKSGFITVSHGVRIGIAGEYVTQNGQVQTIKNITSLNIRIPHNVVGSGDFLYKMLLNNGLHSTLLYSKAGFGKTTMLRDLAVTLSKSKEYNILVFDERCEISAVDGEGNGYNLGDRVDVVRCYSKKSAIANAVRAMKPQIIITDELYGKEDTEAIEYAVNCGICVIASSHVCDKNILKEMPFEFYAELTGIGKNPVIYDKNFNTYCGGGLDDLARRDVVGG